MSQNTKKPDRYRIGVISDTHGHLRPEALKAFEDVDYIIHAGDIGDSEVIEGLRELAPVYAVRGNMDWHGWAFEFPRTEVVKIGDFLFYVLHDLQRLDLDPKAAKVGAVISGHTHRGAIARRDGVLFVNPGAAAKFKSPATVAIIHVGENSLHAELIELKD
jgi:putative phosphoesterase